LAGRDWQWEEVAYIDSADSDATGKLEHLSL